MSIKSDDKLIIKHADIINETGRGIETTGTLILENVTMTCKNRCLDLRGAGKAEIGEGCVLTSTGGDTTVFVYDDNGNVPELVVKGKVCNPYHFKSETDEYGGFAISSNGKCVTAGTNIVIESGADVSSEYDCAIYMPNDDEVTINGGLIEGFTGIYQKCGTLTVNGGQIVGKGTQDYIYSGGGCNATGNAVVVEFTNYPNGLPFTYINSGTLTSENRSGAIGYAKSPKCAESSSSEELASALITADGYTLEALN